MELLRKFEQITKGDVRIAGGKGASLGEMTQAGIAVPPGFIILSSAFDRFLEETSLHIEIESILRSVHQHEIHTIEYASEKIQALILSAPMPTDIAAEIQKYFIQLNSTYVAVRSSATSEDSLDAAWAGQLDTYLNTTAEHLLENVKKCWASLFTPRAIFYRFEKQLHAHKISVAVVVQKMIESEMSGIAFSVHPVTEDQNQMIIEAGYGLGEAIVSGTITPDSYVIEKIPRQITNTTVDTQKRGLYRALSGGNEWRDISPEQGEQSVLSIEQVLELAEIIITIESHYGFPCDIEWAHEKGKFYIVQSRPITTLSTKIINDGLAVGMKVNHENKPLSFSTFKDLEQNKTKKIVYITNSQEIQKTVEGLYPFGKRENTPFIESIFSNGIIMQNKIFEYMTPLETIGFIDGYISYSTQQLEEAKKLFTSKIEEDPTFFARYFDYLEKTVKNFNTYVENKASQDFKKLSKKELTGIFHCFIEYSLKIATYLFPPLLPEDWYVERISEYLQKKINVEREYEKFQDVLQTLITSHELSEVQKRENAIQKLAREIEQDNLLDTKNLNTNDLINSKYVDTFNSIQKEYGWVFDDTLKFEKESVDSLIRQCIDILKKGVTKEGVQSGFDAKQKEYEKVYVTDESIARYISETRTLPHLRFLRIETIIKNAHHFDAFFKRLSDELRIEHVKYYPFWDISESLDTGKLLDALPTYKSHITTRDAIYYLTDDQAKETANVLNPEVKNNGTLQGAIACKGLVQGRVRILLNKKDISSFLDGEILVTSMTTPAFVPAMKKAAAIVTDEGGISCHAAIISRELKVPCVIGTKVATKTLNDGDLVEVDAHHGVVKILQRTQ